MRICAMHIDAEQIELLFFFRLFLNVWMIYTDYFLFTDRR